MIMTFPFLSADSSLKSTTGLASDSSPRRSHSGQQKNRGVDLGSPVVQRWFCEGDYVLITRNRPASAAGGVVKYQK
jgi:hypothetical protein